MKKELFYYSILVLFIVGLLLSETISFKGRKENTSKVIDITSFEKLDIDLACTFYVSIGDQQKVVFEGPEKYLDLLETQMENGVLKISSRKTGFLAQLFGNETNKETSLNVYIKLTSADQLIVPRKGNLITNEISLYDENEQHTILDKGIAGLLKIFGTQLGYIKML